MAWLPWSSGSTAEEGGVKKTAGGAFESPSRTNRKVCYAARDSFFECLDKNNILDSINTKSGREKAETFCSQFDKEFEKSCAHSWVSFFLLPTEDQQTAQTAVRRALSTKTYNTRLPGHSCCIIANMHTGRILQEAARRQLPKGADHQETRIPGRRDHSTTTAAAGPEVGQK